MFYYEFYRIYFWVYFLIKWAFIFLILRFFYKKLENRIENIEQFIKENIKVEKTKTVIEPQEEPKEQLPTEITQEQLPKQFILLIDFIKQQITKGINKESLKNMLLQYGWQENEIEKAYSLAVTSISREESIVTSQPASTITKSFLDWLKEDWLLKLGSLMLLISFGWLVRYAFLHNWIGPQGRIAFGLFAGTLIMLWGWHRIKNYLNQGSILLVLGSTTILLTVFAARIIYDFFSPFSALMLMFLSTAFVALASIKYRNEWLSILSLILAAIAPLLTNAPRPDYVGLFSYLFVTTLGALWIVWLTGYRSLIFVSFVIIALYSYPHLSPMFSSLETINETINLLQKLLLFAYGFAALFFLTTILGFLRSKDKANTYDLITAAGNGLLLLSWIRYVVAPEWQVLIIVAWAVVFAVGAFSVFRMINRRDPFYIYATISCVFLAVATYIQLENLQGILTIAYTIESGLVVILVYLLFGDISLTKKVSWIFIGPVLLSFRNMFAEKWQYGVIHEHFFALLVLALTFIGLGLFFQGRLQNIANKN